MTRIAFLGQPGSYSDLACRKAFPGNETIGFPSFTEVFTAASDGRAELAMIPVDNSVAGRIADVHHLLPESDLHIVGEHFQRIEHHLLAPKGATLQTVKTVKSHVQPIGQCRRFLQKMGYTTIVAGDSATAAKDVAEKGDPTVAAISSSLSGDSTKRMSAPALKYFSPRRNASSRPWVLRASQRTTIKNSSE